MADSECESHMLGRCSNAFNVYVKQKGESLTCFSGCLKVVGTAKGSDETH